MSHGKVQLHSSSTHRSAPKWSFTSRGADSGKEAAPGPGKYGAPSIAEKYKSTPSYGFGSSQREMTKKFAGLPGPGVYTPFDPNQTSPKWGFGSGPRLAKHQQSCAPDPGRYNLPGAMERKPVSITGRPKVRKSASLPGPGAYMPMHDQVEESAPRMVPGSEDRTKGSFTKSFSCAPGPGHYQHMKELGGNALTRSCPNFSMQPRRKPVKCDATPGPCLTHYSQF